MCDPDWGSGEGDTLVIVDRQGGTSSAIVLEACRGEASKLTLTAGGLQRAGAVHLTVLAVVGERPEGGTSSESTNHRALGEDVEATREDLEDVLQGAVGATRRESSTGTSVGNTVGEKSSRNVDVRLGVQLGDDGGSGSVGDGDSDGDTSNPVDHVVDEIGGHPGVIGGGGVGGESAQGVVGDAVTEVTSLTNGIENEAALRGVGADVGPLDCASGDVSAKPADVRSVGHDGSPKREVGSLTIEVNQKTNESQREVPPTMEALMENAEVAPEQCTKRRFISDCSKV